MQDDVYNRALFRRKSEAARSKLREMGGVSQQPRGIMASSPELMAAAMPAMQMRQTGMAPTTMAPQMQPMPAAQAPQPLPAIVPGVLPALGAAPQMQVQPQMKAQPQMQMQPQMRTQPQMQVQPQMKAQPQMQMQPQMQLPQQPRGFAPGGSVDLVPLGVQTGEFAVDITETPVPRVTPAAVIEELNKNPAIQENPQLQETTKRLGAAVTSDKVSNKDKAALVAGAVTGASSKEARAKALEQMTGQKVAKGTEVDQINQSIAQAVLGGAIGGPGSVAERIADAMVKGLSLKRETAVKREDQAMALQVALAKAKGGGAKSWLDTPEGKQAADLYEKMRTPGNRSHEAALAELNKLAPGLGDRFAAAMGGGGVATPAAGSAPAARPPGIYTQNGHQFRVNADGTSKYIGPAS